MAKRRFAMLLWSATEVCANKLCRTKPAPTDCRKCQQSRDKLRNPAALRTLFQADRKCCKGKGEQGQRKPVNRPNKRQPCRFAWQHCRCHRNGSHARAP